MLRTPPHECKRGTSASCKAIGTGHAVNDDRHVRYVMFMLRHNSVLLPLVVCV